MGPKRALNAKNLEALGAERLAKLLIETARGRSVAQRLLRLELAGLEGTAELAREVRLRPATIGRSRAGPFADHKAAAPGAAGLVDQGARRRPAGVVEHGLVQRREDALEGIVRIHAVCPFRRLSAVGRRARAAQARSREWLPGLRSAVRLSTLRAFIARLSAFPLRRASEGDASRNQVGTRPLAAS